MAYIRVDVSHPIKNGSSVSFKAPCDCNAVAGLKVYFPNDGGIATSQVFLFTDAHGNNLTGIGHLFATGALVKVILNLDEGKAYIQNADTNKYLEEQFGKKADLQNGKVPTSQLPAMNYAPSSHVSDAVKHITSEERAAWNGKAPAYSYGTEDLTAGSSALGTGTLYFVYE